MKAPHSPRRLVREALELLPGESTFAAFCLDYFPATAREFSGGMTHSERISLLLERHTALSIAQALR